MLMNLVRGESGRKTARGRPRSHEKLRRRTLPSTSPDPSLLTGLVRYHHCRSVILHGCEAGHEGSRPMADRRDTGRLPIALTITFLCGLAGFLFLPVATWGQP